MRAIKFRGKRCRDGKWVYGFYCEATDTWNGLHPHKSWILGHARSNGGWFAMQGATAVIDDTVGQFTGLCDKNGKEIYEGDIMGLPKCDAVGIEYKNRYVRVVEWINDGFFLVEHCEMGGELRKYGDRLALEISLKSSYAGIARCFKERGLDYTVIGNIHDNPELLIKL